MANLTKKRKEVITKVDKNKLYPLSEAAALIKSISYTKFDASVDVDVRLGVDPRKANQMVRGSVTLPHGTGKTFKVLVLCTPDKEEEAKAAEEAAKAAVATAKPGEAAPAVAGATAATPAAAKPAAKPAAKK